MLYSTEWPTNAIRRAYLLKKFKLVSRSQLFYRMTSSGFSLEWIYLASSFEWPSKAFRYSGEFVYFMILSDQQTPFNFLAYSNCSTECPGPSFSTLWPAPRFFVWITTSELFVRLTCSQHSIGYPGPSHSTLLPRNTLRANDPVQHLYIKTDR